MNPWHEQIVEESRRRLENNRRAESSPRLRASIIRRCREEPLWWLRNFAKGVDPRDRLYRIQPFIPWYEQAVLFLAILQGRSIGVDKSRDTGASFIVTLAILWQLMFRQDIAWGCGSKTGSDVYDGTTDSVMGKIKWQLEQQPIWLRGDSWVFRASPHPKIANTDLNNYAIGRKTTPDAWHGPRLTGVFLDELARIPRLTQVMKGVDGATDQRIGATTPAGPSGWWPKLRRGEGPAIQQLNMTEVMGRDWQPVHLDDVDQLLWNLMSLHHSQDPRKGPEWAEKKRASMTARQWAEQYEIDYLTSADGLIWPEFHRHLHVLDDETWAEVLRRHLKHMEIYEAWDMGHSTSVVWIGYLRSKNEAFVLDYRSWYRVLAFDIVHELSDYSAPWAPMGWQTAFNPDGRCPNVRVGDPFMYGKHASTLRSWHDDMRDMGVHIVGKGLAGRVHGLQVKVSLAFKFEQLWLSPLCLVKHNQEECPAFVDAIESYRLQVREGQIDPPAVKGPESHPAEALTYGVDAIWPGGKAAGAYARSYGGQLVPIGETAHGQPKLEPR